MSTAGLSGDSKRLLVWLYERDQASGTVGHYSTAQIRQGLGLSEREVQVAVSQLINQYVWALAGERNYSAVTLLPSGFALAETEFRQRRLAENVFDELCRIAWEDREKAFSNIGNMGFRSGYDADLRSEQLATAEERYVERVIDAKVESIQRAVPSEPDDETKLRVKHFATSLIAEANDRLMSVGSLLQIQPQSILSTAERKVAIALDRRALGNSDRQSKATTVIENQTNIVTGSHSQVVGTAERASLVQMNVPAETRELVAAIDAVVNRLGSYNISDQDRQATSETLTDMRAEAEKPKPRKKFLRWCADQFPSAIRTTADVAKIIDVVLKLTYGQ